MRRPIAQKTPDASRQGGGVEFLNGRGVLNRDPWQTRSNDRIAKLVVISDHEQEADDATNGGAPQAEEAQQQPKRILQGRRPSQKTQCVAEESTAPPTTWNRRPLIACFPNRRPTISRPTM